MKQCLLSLNETEPDIRKVVSYNGWYKGELVKDRVEIQEQGQCKAVNAGVSITNTPWIIVSNDDMIYPPGWFDKLIEPIDEKIFCISPKLIENEIGSPTFQVYDCGRGNEFNKNKFLEFANNYKEEGLRKGFNLPFLIKRELWDLIGGYDINYDPWSNNSDSDLEYKIRLAGVQPYQNTNSIIYHFSRLTGTYDPHNHHYFIDKWGFERTDDGIWTADFDVPGKERIFRPEWENHFEAK